EATGLNLVANGWWVSAPGAWNRSISKMSLGVDRDNNLFALWTQFTDDDKSVGAWSNGELYISYSIDGGVAWSTPENITNTPTPDCWPTECDSDHWSTLGEEVDDYLHVTYMNDKDAGGIPQTEGVDTENPVMYYAYPNPLFSGVEEEEAPQPRTFSLIQNYPNPFNASTTIDYVTKTPGKVELAVYNLVGEKVEVLVNKAVPAGEHTVTWDAANVATGVYYYKLSSSEGTITKRMLLLR
ncbi:MAG: T9SS type A sorting domain-containing protein, partial [Candidatus Zixiibacteriota bacterium]